MMKTHSDNGQPKGFALIATISIMALLVMIALGMLSLSAIEVRSSRNGQAMAEAQANARMALMIALGELQKEMGPDMRISAEAAIHDTDPTTEQIDDVAQPHWLAVYDSWGGWLNGEYTPDGKDAADVSSIGDTYGAKRAPMFRRWLVSLPEASQTDVDAAETGLSDKDSVVLVGKGSLGEAYTAANPNKVTRAYKTKVGERSSYAWWVGPENHKAKVNLAAQSRTLSTDQWATAQGNTAQVAVGKIDGLENLDIADPQASARAKKLFTLGTLRVPGIGIDHTIAKQLFFDLTETSVGVLSNAKTGGLKKDLSLLFENNDTSIAPQYAQADRMAPEPSIRPHSKDVLAENAVLPRRPFASWTNMRHYYRMYRADSDTALPVFGHTADRTRDLSYSATSPRPSTRVHIPYAIHQDSPDDNYTDTDNDRWHGQNSYQRVPILVRFLMIHGYETVRIDDKFVALADPADPNFYAIALVLHNIPVFTYWNPYTTPLVIKSDKLGVTCDTNIVWPHMLSFYNKDGNQRPSVNGGLQKGATSANKDRAVPLRSENGADIVLEPGELRMFSYPAGSRFNTRSGDQRLLALFEGFDPLSTGALADKHALKWKRVINKSELGNDELPDVLDMAMEFGEARHTNALDGNTPGSFTLKMSPPGKKWGNADTPANYQIDWFQVGQQRQLITNKIPMTETYEEMVPLAYSLLALKGVSEISSDAPSFDAGGWRKDWRSRNWLHAPPYYFGSGLYMSQDPVTAHTQRMDSPYEVSFGPTSDGELIKLTGETASGKPFLGFGSTPYEKVSAVPALELPTAPLSSLASFSGMRMNPGWIWSKDLNDAWAVSTGKENGNDRGKNAENDTKNSTLPKSFLYGAAKAHQYQSGITGGGIGNSFIHPMIPREEVYFYHNNSISIDQNFDRNKRPTTITTVDTKAYSDYWDHGLMLNDSLWDEYFISSIADQTRPWAGASDNLQANIESLTDGNGLPISRYQYRDGGLGAAEVQAKLKQDDGYLKAAEHLMVDGAFNVNSTSVHAWYALFKGIRERKLFYRDSSGALSEVVVPDDHIALSRFDTPTTNLETTDPETGVSREDGNRAWSGVRFIDDDQLKQLAQKCVEQVKLRGPFLNFSEFINRRLEESDLGLMGALQSAIDYDDDPTAVKVGEEPINKIFKTATLTMTGADLGVAGGKTSGAYPTPESVNGSRLAGTPGYVIQSDLLKPIANTLTVRDDTFRIRAYGETLDSAGKVIARAWCEAVVQRLPEYLDPSNDAHEPAYKYVGEPVTNKDDPGWNGEFVPNDQLSATNQEFGRKFIIKSFRWLNPDEV